MTFRSETKQKHFNNKEIQRIYIFFNDNFYPVIICFKDYLVTRKNEGFCKIRINNIIF